MTDEKSGISRLVKMRQGDVKEVVAPLTFPPPHKSYSIATRGFFSRLQMICLVTCSHIQNFAMLEFL
jgi:hypothetical protein